MWKGDFVENEGRLDSCEKREVCGGGGRHRQRPADKCRLLDVGRARPVPACALENHHNGLHVWRCARLRVVPRT